MTIEQYNEATQILEEIESCKSYLGQFQSVLDGVEDNPTFDNKDEEIEFFESKKVLSESIEDLKNDIRYLENRFALI